MYTSWVYGEMQNKIHGSSVGHFLKWQVYCFESITSNVEYQCEKYTVAQSDSLHNPLESLKWNTTNNNTQYIDGSYFTINFHRISSR